MTVETRPAVIPAEPRTKTVADVLRHAARIIEERGWSQDSTRYQCPDGTVCMVGAVGIAEAGYAEGFEIQGPTYRLLTRFVVYRGFSLPEWWNDEPGRTASEVTAALRAAADAAERSDVQ